MLGPSQVPVAEQLCGIAPFRWADREWRRTRKSVDRRNIVTSVSPSKETLSEVKTIWDYNLEGFIVNPLDKHHRVVIVGYFNGDIETKKRFPVITPRCRDGIG